MRKLILILPLLVSLLTAQTARYPGAIAGDSDLGVARNRVATTMVGTLSAIGTSFVVKSATNILVNEMLTLSGSEIVWVCGVSGTTITIGKASCPNVDGRAFDRSTAVAHINGASVENRINQYYWGSLKAEVIAMQTTFGANLANSFLASSYDFAAQTPGGSLVALGVNQTVTLTPCPAGVNGADANHYLYLTGGTGTAEATPITGGTCTSGATTGTVTLTPTNAHSGAWTIRSATAGISEALWAVPASGAYSAGAATILINGYVTTHAPITSRSTRNVRFQGGGPQTTQIAVATDFPLTASGVFVLLGVSGPPAYSISSAVTDMSILFSQPDEATLVNYHHWPPAIYTSGTWHPLFANLEIIAAWTGIKADSAIASQGGLTIDNCQISAFSRGIEIDQSYQPTIISNTTVDPEGLLNNQITAFFVKAGGPVALYLGRIDALEVHNFVTDADFGDFHLGGGGTDTGPNGSMSNVWSDLGNFTMSAGNIQVSNGQFGTGSAVAGITYTGGILRITDSIFTTTSAHTLVDAQAVRGFSGTNYPPSLQISNSYFHTFSADVNAVSCVTIAPYAGVFTCQLTNNVFVRTTDIVYTAPSVSVTDGTGSTLANITGNVWLNGPGIGSGYAVFLTNDQYHTVTSNIYRGWALGTPATMAKVKVDLPLLAASTAVSSGATIAPTGPIFHVTGTGTITAITTPAGFPYSQFVTIPDGAFQYTAGATVGLTGTATVGRSITWTKDVTSTKWYPSY